MIGRLRRPKPNRAAVAQTETYAAPVRGLNYRESLATMKPTDALRLDNIICRPGYLEVRKGRIATATGLPAVPETIFTYTGNSGANKLFAAAGSGIYDVTSSGAVGAAVVTPITNAYWAQTQVSNTGGNYLLAVNGTDTGQIYNGSTWAALGFTGLATTSMVQLAVWKRRVWVVEKNSISAWYGATDAISGPVTEFSFAGIFRRGGYLKAILNWTVDGGDGNDDYFLAVTSMGEIAVYRGSDPTSEATFSLSGVYYVGAPVGDRFYASYGGDVLLLTVNGLVPLTRYLQSQTVNKSQVLTDRIQQLISSDITSYGSTQGWELHVYFDDNFLFVQVPAGNTSLRYQYVMSLITGAWSRFLIPSQTWMVQGTRLFMGVGTGIFNAWSGGVDVTDPIKTVIVPAFSYFGSPTRRKKFNLGRTLIESDQTPLYYSTLLVDFNQNYLFPNLVPGPASGNLWDVGVWDSAQWGFSTSYSRQWYSIAGLGYAACQALQIVSQANSTKIISIDYVFEPGGLL